jgi:hypothetical protein
MKPTDIKTLKNHLATLRMDNSPKGEDPTRMFGGWGKGTGRYHSECRAIRALERAIAFLEQNS